MGNFGAVSQVEIERVLAERNLGLGTVIQDRPEPTVFRALLEAFSPKAKLEEAAGTLVFGSDRTTPFLDSRRTAADFFVPAATLLAGVSRNLDKSEFRLELIQLVREFDRNRRPGGAI